MRQNKNKSGRVIRSDHKTRRTEDPDTNDCSPTILTRLQGLTTPKLKQLLQTYKVLHRSKLHTKDAMIQALEPLIRDGSLSFTEVEHDSTQITLPPIDRVVDHTKSSESAIIQKDPISQINGPVARRYDDPVMGIDVHRDTLAFSIVNAHTVIVAGERENTEEGVDELIHLCQKHGVVIVGMESTSEYWLPVHWAFQKVKIATLIANPQQTKATQGIKTDPQDAQRIAFALRDGRLKPSVICTPEAYALRKNLRELVHQVDATTAVQNRLQQIFHKCRAGKDIPKYLHTNRGSQLLLGLINCTTIDDVYLVVKEAYATHKGRTTDPQKLQPLARNLKDFLGRLDALHDRSRFYELLDEFYAHKAREHEILSNALCYAKIHPEFKKNLELLLSIPCVGLQTAVIILAEIVDIKLFPSVKNLTKWAGLVPRTNKSGFRKRGQGKIYKGGNHYLRRALWLAAQSDFQFGNDSNHIVGGIIQKLKVQKKKSYKQAVTAGAHKLLRVVYGVLSTQTPYHGCSDPSDQERLIRMTQRKINEFDRTLSLTPQTDNTPLCEERLTQTLKRVYDAKDRLESLYQEVYGKRLPIELVENWKSE